jgi:hypothetical protein
MEVSGQLHAPCRFTSRETVPGVSCVGWPQSRSRRYEGENTLLPLRGNEPQLLGHPVYNLVAIPTELSRLRKRTGLNVYVKSKGRNLSKYLPRYLEL